MCLFSWPNRKVGIKFNAEGARSTSSSAAVVTTASQSHQCGKAMHQCSKLFKTEGVKVITKNLGHTSCTRFLLSLC